jgi:hypothetical protein
VDSRSSRSLQIEQTQRAELSLHEFLLFFYPPSYLTLTEKTPDFSRVFNVISYGDPDWVRTSDPHPVKMIWAISLNFLE